MVGMVLRRVASSDTLMWQVPVLSLTAQSFLLTIALGGGSSHVSRSVAGGLCIDWRGAARSLPSEQPVGVTAEPEHPVNGPLERLIGAWCDRRDLRPLAIMLPAYTSNGGLTDSWAAVMEALRDLRAYGRLPGDEQREVERLLTLVEKAVYRTSRPDCDNALVVPRNRFRRRSVILTMKAFVAPVVVVLLAGCGAGHSSSVPSTASRQVVQTAPSTGPRSQRLSARVVLPTTTVIAGSSMSGRLVVDNNTGRALHVGDCGFPFQVALTNSQIQTGGAWAACIREFTIPVGRSSYPVPVRATYLGCGGIHLPACVKRNGSFASPPLPPGEYDATLLQASKIVPPPPPITVRVTAQS
jgi:hypothetical protein